MIAATRLALRDFRNYERAETRLGPAITVLSGPNGAGKTNLLEGLHFGLTARSPRTSNERELVKRGAAAARSEVTTEAEDGEHLLEVALQPGHEKRTRVDGSARWPAPDACPPVLAFLPERLELVKGVPALRRAHLDRFVAGAWPSRAASRTAYGRALTQRNALLGRIRAGAASERDLDPWDAQLARCGLALMRDRSQAAAALSSRFAVRGQELGLPDGVELRYRPRSRAEDSDALVAELRERRAGDLDRGFTTHGPHRDDLALVQAGRGLRAYGSQGQQRLAVLALLFAERDVLADHGHFPLMLLDDVMSELDFERRERLVALLRTGGQALITATDLDQVPGAADEPATLVRVEGGAVLDGQALPA